MEQRERETREAYRHREDRIEQWKLRRRFVAGDQLDRRRKEQRQLTKPMALALTLCAGTRRSRARWPLRLDFYTDGDGRPSTHARSFDSTGGPENNPGEGR